jgi:uncharacterized protein (DUF2147 family)
MKKLSSFLFFLLPATLCGLFAQTLPASENPDPAKRNRKLEGLEISSGLTYTDGKWKGTIYDPESGKTYNSQIKLVNENTLELTGYVGLPMFGLTETWKRSSHDKD